MGNVLSTDAYPILTWHPLLLWAKFALFTAYTHSVASGYFALDKTQLVCLYNDMDREIQRLLTAWSHIVREALKEHHFNKFWSEVERMPHLSNEALNEIGLSGCILAHRSQLSFML